MKQIITKLYTAFQNKVAETMATCYHSDILFKDPVFGQLKGGHASNMWRMLCQNSSDLKIEFQVINDNQVKWEATYKFRKTGRKVHNKITADFEFKDGLIIKHTDNFDLHKWAKQALGFRGLLLGGTDFFKKKLNQKTAKLLTKFETNK